MKIKTLCATCMLLGVISLALPVCAQDFSADMSSVSPEGSFNGKIYVSGDKSRVEMQDAVTISRMDKKIVWVLMPAEKMFLEQQLDPRSASSTREKMDGEIERKVEGSEKVSGRNTVKYRVIFELEGKREEVFQWIDEAAHIPVKTAAVDGSWSSEFKNIFAGPQKQELFEIPAGYRKMSLGMPDMKDLLGAISN